MTEGNFQYSKEILEEEPCAVVTGLLQERRHVAVPESLGGLPVRGIAPHAFSGQAQLRDISFPRSLRSVGAFALHHCPQLVQLSLHDGITDFHNGVLRQDVRLRRIRLAVHEGNYTVMRDILSETDAKLQFCLELPEGETRLLFPGYDYSFAENTMARTIQFSILGSGLEYRECVRRRKIGWREYDRLFRRVVHDDPRASAEIASDRLLYPHDLAPVFQEGYEEYLRAHARDALLWFTEELEADPEGPFAQEAYARLHLMSDRRLFTAQDADDALRLAAEAGLTEAAGIILSGREGSPGPETAGSLSLDDW